MLHGSPLSLEGGDYLTLTLQRSCLEKGAVNESDEGTSFGHGSLTCFLLDKKAAAVEALKDYSIMQYIIEHSDEDIYELETRMTSPHSAKITENALIDA